MPLDWELKALASTGLLGPLEIASLGVSLVCAIALVVAAVKSRRAGGSRAFVVLGSITILNVSLGAIAAGLIAASVRHDMLLPLRDLVDHQRFAHHLTEMVAAIDVLGLALPPIAVIASVAAVLRWSRSSPLAATAAASSALVLGVTGGALAYHVRSGCMSVGSFESGDRIAYLQALAEDMLTFSARTRVVIASIAAIGSALLVILARAKKNAPEHRHEEPRLAIGGSLFAFGVAAWIGARDLAFDARHLLPRPTEDRNYCSLFFFGSDVSSAPPAGSCDARCEAPVVTLGDRGPYVTGSLVADPADVAKMLEQHRQLYRQIAGRDPARPYGLLAAPRAEKTTRVEPFVGVIKDGYSGGVAFVGALPIEHVATKTLGDITLNPRCCCSTLPLDPKGEPLTSRATWGEVVRDAAAGTSFSITAGGR